MTPSRTYVVTVEVEVAMTNKGSPAHMGSVTYPGHPAEGPEFECGNMYVNEQLIAPAKAAKDFPGPHSLARALDAAICKAAESLAALDNWNDYDDGDT